MLVLLSAGSYAQGLAQEGFETWPPTNWGIYDNGFDTTISWSQSEESNPFQPPYGGNYAAFLDRNNVLPGSTLPQDWLVTPRFTLPENAELHFFSRLAFEGNQGSNFKVLISKEPIQGNFSDYTLVQQWTESQLNPQQQVYREIIVPLPEDMEGELVYVAFVMEGDEGDRWLIDNVKVVQKCLEPLNLTATDVSTTTASLGWDNPAMATNFEVAVILAGAEFNGTGSPYSGAIPFEKTGLLENTEYKFYVRAVCSGENFSTWKGPFNFRTYKTGDSCTAPIIINTLPYTVNGNTENNGDVYDGVAGEGCGTDSGSGYLNGNDVVFAYTAPVTGTISIDLANVESTSGVFVYDSCGDVGISCIAGATSGWDGTTASIPSIPVTANQTYYFVISSWFSDTTAYTITVQQESCPKPADLTAGDTTVSSISLNWTEAGTATSWQYALQPLGAGIPMGNGISVNSASITINDLPESTQYAIYVRAVCGDGTFSSWTGPVMAHTQCGAFTVPFYEGFNSDSNSEFCWTVANIDADDYQWNLNKRFDPQDPFGQGDPFEGDEAAHFDTSAVPEHNDMLISPAILLTGNQRLKFHLKTDNLGAVGFKVLLSTTGTDPEDFTTELMPLTRFATSTYVEKTINLSAVPAGPVYIAWYIPQDFSPGYQLMLDKIIIEDLPACTEPVELTASNITSTTANLSWTPGNGETNWEIVVLQQGSGFPPTDETPGIPVTGTYPASGLFPNSNYRYFVRSICGTEHSVWAEATFTTACQVFEVPFFEGFNTNSTSAQCWEVLNLDGDGANWCWQGPGCLQGTYEGDGAPVMNTTFNSPDNNDWLISPPIRLTANQRLKYHYKVDDSASSAGFKVLLSTTQREPEDFTNVLLPEATYSNNDFVKEVISLEAYTGVVYIAWQVPPSYTGESLLIVDNIIVEDIPVCPEPLHTEISNVTQTSAQLSWTPGGTETEWEVLVYADGEPVPATGLTATAIPYSLTTLANGRPLQSGTIYHVLVKAVCSDTESSVASDIASFVTLISNDECSSATVVPVNAGPGCELYAAGTVNGATESSQVNPCGDWTYADDDVWFEFTATAALQSISIFDISHNGRGSGRDTFLMYIVYEGDNCGNLTQIGDCMGAYAEFGIESSTVVFNNLTVGNKYSIRVFSAEENTNQTATFKVCVKEPVTPIAINNTQYTVPQLVTDVLLGGEGCAQVSNITWSTGTNYPDPDNIFGDNPNGIAYFNQNGSTFPFAEGILLTTGDALRAEGHSDAPMEHGSAVWLGDEDIDQVMADMLGDNVQSTNASVIEFDFVPSIPSLSFDFIFASEEYGDFIQCFSWDTFAILLTDEDGNEQNIAVIPGTTQAISVFNISGNGYPDVCPGYNLPFFDHYNVFGRSAYSPISFAGQSVVMTAIANVEVNKHYHLKIAIAESDNNLDSGVFIKAGSYIGDINLGQDLIAAAGTAPCPGEALTLSNGLNPELYTFSWLKGDEVIEGQTAATLVVTQPGEYTAKAQLLGYDCEISDTIVIEYYAPVVVGSAPLDIALCSTASPLTFNLAQNDAVILTGLNAVDYTVTYHATAEDANDNATILQSPYAGTHNQVIYVRLQKNSTGCYTIAQFRLTINAVTTPVTAFSYSQPLCRATASAGPVLSPGFTTGGTFSSTPALAINPATGVIDITAAAAGTYQVKYKIDPNACNQGGEATFTVIITDAIVPVTTFNYDDTYCMGTSSIAPALASGFTGGGTFEASPAGLSINTATGEINVGTSAAGTYTVSYALQANTATCTPQSTYSDTFTLDEEASFTIAADCRANELILTATTIQGSFEGATYQWLTAADVPVGNDSESFNVTQYVKGTLENDQFPLLFKAVITNGNCESTETITVQDIVCDIQKGISPGDGDKNDAFNLTDMNVTHLSIFNRYGQEVFTYGNYTNQWSGQDKNGNELPTGTYFYSIERANGESRTGWVYINRQN